VFYKKSSLKFSPFFIGLVRSLKNRLHFQVFANIEGSGWLGGVGGACPSALPLSSTPMVLVV